MHEKTKSNQNQTRDQVVEKHARTKKTEMKWDEIAGKESKGMTSKETKKGNNIDMSDTACHPKCRPFFDPFKLTETICILLAVSAAASESLQGHNAGFRDMDLKHSASPGFRDEVFSRLPSVIPALIHFKGCYDVPSVVARRSFSKFIDGLALFAIQIS